MTDREARGLDGLGRGPRWGVAGVPSWSWFYPFHYPPMISDVVEYFRRRWTPTLPARERGAGPAQTKDELAREFVFSFERSEPFKPFQQLLAVLPPSSSTLLPAPYRRLMLDPASPLADFFPAEIKTDLHDKRNDWEAVVLLPFIDQERLVTAMAPLTAALTAEEQARNRLRDSATVYRMGNGAGRPANGTSSARACRLARGGRAADGACVCGVRSGSPGPRRRS